MEVDVLIIQTTGQRKTEINALQELLKQEIQIYPKVIINLMSGVEIEEVLAKIIEKSPHQIRIMELEEVDKDKIILSE